MANGGGVGGLGQGREPGSLACARTMKGTSSAAAMYGGEHVDRQAAGRPSESSPQSSSPSAWQPAAGVRHPMLGVPAAIM